MQIMSRTETLCSHMFSVSILMMTLWGGACIILIVRMKVSRFKEVVQYAQGHTVAWSRSRPKHVLCQTEQKPLSPSALQRDTVFLECSLLGAWANQVGMAAAAGLLVGGGRESCVCARASAWEREMILWSLILGRASIWGWVVWWANHDNTWQIAVARSKGTMTGLLYFSACLCNFIINVSESSFYCLHLSLWPSQAPSLSPRPVTASSPIQLRLLWKAFSNALRYSTSLCIFLVSISMPLILHSAHFPDDDCTCPIVNRSPWRAESGLLCPWYLYSVWNWVEITQS